MRVAIVSECFTPTWNGVTGSVVRIVDHLERRGHTAVVIAPGPGPDRCDTPGATPVMRVPSVTVPAVRSLPVGLSLGAVARALDAFEPDVVHLAAPVVLGEAGARAAHALAVPAVAIYQTDIAGFARRYHLGAASGAAWRWVRRVHNMADLTLAPSSLAEWDLRRNGVAPVARWARGVDLSLWHPDRRDARLRRSLLGPRGEVLVGYAGRLAPEKRVDLLAAVDGIPGVRLVVIGDGPSRQSLRRALPAASFLGYRSGEELATLVASLDVFVHTGPHETFCQAVQEAMAAGVPVVAPASGGPMDLVAHGRTGWLVPPDEPALLREAVAGLAADAGLRSAMGCAGRDAVAGRSWAAVGDELLGHYRRVVGGTLSDRRSAA